MAQRSKYRAVPTVLDGIRFHSKGEAIRWSELKLLERAGTIAALERQVAIPLSVSGKKLGKYVADFAYRDAGIPVIEDYKGIDNPLSRWKRKHVEAEYGLVVRITGAAAPKPRKRAA